MDTKDLKVKKTQSQKHYARMKDDTPEGLPIPATKLRFPIIPKTIEYLDIILKKVTIKSYKKEIAGMSWRKLSEKIYEDGIAAGTYSYGMKFFDNANIYRGFIKSVNSKGDRVTPADPANESISRIQHTIEGLKESLKATGGNSLGIDYILQATQKAHDSEISIYKIQVDTKNEKILELRQDIVQLNTELDQADETIAELQSQGGQNKLTETLLGLVNQFTSPAKPTKKLKLNEKFDGSDIPEDIISNLAQIDYQNIPPDVYEKLKNALYAYSQQLPLKKG